MIDTDRITKIEIGGEKYSLILTTKAVKEIAKKYGSLESVGEKMSSAKNAAEAFSELVWLIVLLANQAILIHNLKNSDKKELLTEEFVELMTTPQDIIKINAVLAKTLTIGVKRNVVGENPKNIKTE
ncbi:MAG: hypothetical protein LBR79_07350 [Oscillospiraceae bacterium]|jgi:hypothetical protein|nr:hypothetical protein [Oscillospiraceae bacterium]